MSELATLLITADPAVARHAELCGVDTIFLDMETRGKALRQGHLDTHRSAHTLDDVKQVKAALRDAELLVRINPPWDETPREVKEAIEAGAERLMLPMFRMVEEVESFKAAVAGRVPVTLLVETAAALARVHGLIPLLQPSDRLHFGLNDLCLDMRLDFLFEVLAGRLLDGPTAHCRAAGVRFGIGGVGRIGTGALPAEWIIGEHVRLGSDSVILSRAFHGGATSGASFIEAIDLRFELAELRRMAAAFESQNPAALLENQARLADRVMQLAVARRADAR